MKNALCKPSKQEIEIARKIKEVLQAEYNSAHAYKVKQAKWFGEEVTEKLQKVKSSLNDIVTLIRCTEDEDYKVVMNTNMYQKHGYEYCRFLEIRREVMQLA